MKLVSYEQTSDYFKNIQSAAIKGALLGGAISLGLRTYILRRSPNVLKQAGGYHRALLYAGPAAFCTMTNMELMSTTYHNRHQPKGVQEFKEKQKPKKWSELLSEYKYQAIVASWAAAMGGSYWMAKRNPFLTRAQKIVQARVYAQGITVLILLASVAFSVGSHNAAEHTEQKKEHLSRSWERGLDFARLSNQAQ